MRLTSPGKSVDSTIQENAAIIGANVMPTLIRNLKQTNPLLGDFAARMDPSNSKHVHTFLKNACAALPMAGVLDAYEAVLSNKHEPTVSAGFAPLEREIKALNTPIKEHQQDVGLDNDYIPGQQPKR